jgi:hypothetical protein
MIMYALSMGEIMQENSIEAGVDAQSPKHQQNLEVVYIGSSKIGQKL